MEKFCLTALGASVYIESDIKLIDFFKTQQDFIEFPPLNISTSVEKCEHRICYHNIPEEQKSISCTSTSMDINFPKEELLPENIAYTSRYLLEKQYAERGLCTCHSACVEKDGKAILLLGDAGAGKTSLAINLCHSKGYKLISNDRTIIGLQDGKLQAFWGSKYIHLRHNSTKENMPYLLPYFPKEPQDPWNTKILRTASELGIPQQHKVTPIDSVYFIHLDSQEKTVRQTPGNTWGNSFKLYANLSQHVRAASSAFMNKYGHPIGFIPSYDTPEIFAKRSELCNAITKQDKYYCLTGNLTNMMHQIDQNHQIDENQLGKPDETILHIPHIVEDKKIDSEKKWQIKK